tara:strand:- start:614 stop:1954 length:1341 start_codon:yes stop_codon:yes gene_type:complete
LNKIGLNYSGQLRNYTIEKAIGQGSGMGDVFIAKDQNQNNVVIKFSKIENDAKDEIRKEKLEFETQILKQLTKFKNPYTVKYIDQSPPTNSDTFLVMELLDGDHVKAKVGRSPMPEAEVIKIVTKVAKALDGLHSHDAIHRDIKPKNIMIKNNGEPVLIDFGAAKMLYQGIASVGDKTGLHTEGWTCPHQEISKQRLTPQCDLYALGRTIFYMVTGVPPETQLFDFNYSQISGKSLPFLNNKGKTLLRQCSSTQAFSNIVEKLLDPDHQTYHTASQLILELNQINSRQSGPQHLGSSQKRPYIVIQSDTITLDPSWKHGLLIGKWHDEKKCKMEKTSLRCNHQHEGKNHLLGHSGCKSGCTCFSNPRHWTKPHHMRIWYDQTQKKWKIVNNTAKGTIASSAKKSPSQDWQKMEHKKSYTLNHNDDIALIYVTYPDPIPITFSFYEH